MRGAFLFLLGSLEYLLFSDSFSQFFQGDALFYMSHRYRSWSEFVHALYTLDVAHWYRPLSAQTIPSLFFPRFGLDPHGYHWVTFLLFFATTCVVFFFLEELTKNFVAAAAGTAFFSLHWMNVYVTYDFAFTPELFYAAFYLLSCIAYLKGGASRRWYIASLAFFVLALMSKEPAVTLAANIVLLALFFAPGRSRRDLLPFFAIFAAYYLYIVRYLKVGAGDYGPAWHSALWTRMQDSLLWAFDLARGRMWSAVVIAALLVVIYTVASLGGRRRRVPLFGIAWFFIALSPMLLNVTAFGLYYLFLPLAGIALIVGEYLRWVHDKISPWNRPMAIVAVCAALVPFVLAARRNAQIDLYSNTALGYAGRIAETSARDLKQAHPMIPRGATVYIVSDAEPELWRYYGIHALPKLLYDDDTLDVRYSSLGHTIPDEALRSGKLVVMKYANGGLLSEDPLSVLTTKREENVPYVTSDRISLQVFPARVVAGMDAYTVRISGTTNTEAELQYRFNEGPIATTKVRLNAKGETRFFVSAETKRGTYRFVGLRFPGEPAWIKVDAIVTVRDGP